MTMTQREKLLVFTLLALVVLWLDYTYIIHKQLDVLALSQKELISYQQKYQTFNDAPAKIKELEKKRLELDGQSMDLLNSKFTTTQQEEIILLLTDLGDDEGFRITQVNFEPAVFVVPEDETLSVEKIMIEYEGTYEGLTVFLKRVWGFQKDIIVEDLLISTGTGEVLSGSVNLALFSFVSPSGIEYQDNLYQFLIDENFFKVNPFIHSEGEADFRINNFFTGGKSGAQIPYTPFTDIKGHWAENEINVFGELGYIKKGQSEIFSPESPMTRGEFIIMIDSIYQWPIPSEPVDLTQYTDYGNLGSYENAISKAVVKGLMSGYVVGFQDNTLRPRDPITYSDVEYIMQRIKNDTTLTWETVGTMLLQEKSVQSVGMTDKNGLMTKAEAVYLMTHFK